jgi:hypothetical protein
MDEDIKTTDDQTKALVPITEGQLAPTDLEGLWRIASIMSKSGMVPSEFRMKPEKCFVAMQLGMEVGLGFMAAIQTISVINGKPALYGDGIPAVIQGRGQCEKWEEYFELDGEKMKHYPGPTDLNQWPDNLTAVCILRRKGFDEPFEGYFTVADAKRMGKWNKPEKQGGLSVWQKYPLRMLKMRARGFATRDGFSDHLKGMAIYEEVQDNPVRVSVQDEVSTTVETNPMDEALDSPVVDAEYQEQPADAANGTQEPESPQETPLSDSQDPNQAIKHPLVLHFEGKLYTSELIEKFITWAAEMNEMDEVSLMNEAMTDVEDFEKAMLEYANENGIVQMASQAPDSEDEPADLISDDLAAAIDDSAEQCQAAGKVLDNAEVPEEDRKIATQEGLFDQDGNKIEETEEKETVENPVTGEALDENADINGWCARFVKQYNLKNKHQFSPFVLQNEDKFRQLHAYSPDLYDKAVNKWTRFYKDEPWPVCLDPDRDQVGEEAPAGEETVVEPTIVKINEAARIFTNDDIEGNPQLKFKKMKELFGTYVDKAIKDLKMASGGLSDSAIEVVAFAVKELIAKEKKGKK